MAFLGVLQRPACVKNRTILAYRASGEGRQRSDGEGDVIGLQPTKSNTSSVHAHSCGGRSGSWEHDVVHLAKAKTSHV